MQRIPFSFDAEYRGVTKAAGDFVRRDTGQVINAPARLSFEHRDEDDILLTVEFGATAFDKLTPVVNWADFSPGDKVQLRGVCVMADRGSDKDSYPTLTGVKVLTGKAAMKAAA